MIFIFNVELKMTMINNYYQSFEAILANKSLKMWGVYININIYIYMEKLTYKD